MTAAARRALGICLLVAAITLAVTVGAPLPGGALIAVGALAVAGIRIIDRTGAFDE